MIWHFFKVLFKNNLPIQLGRDLFKKVNLIQIILVYRLVFAQEPFNVAFFTFLTKHWKFFKAVLTVSLDKDAL